MRQEQKDEIEQLNDGFKNVVFANNPELYQQMFKDELPPDDDQVDWLVPKNEDDVKEILKELREAGIDAR